MKFKLDNSYPKELDYKDSQNSFRDKFLIPPKSIYLCGHSLGCVLAGMVGITIFKHQFYVMNKIYIISFLQ